MYKEYKYLYSLLYVLMIFAVEAFVHIDLIFRAFIENDYTSIKEHNQFY
jgi:hypothetical protein